MPRDTPCIPPPQRPQAEDQTERAEERWYAAKVGRLISERDREDAEEYRNTMETMRQVAEEQCDIRERSPESVRDDERQTAGASTQQLLQRMDRFEAYLAQLASRLHGREALLKSLQELLRQGMTKK